MSALRLTLSYWRKRPAVRLYQLSLLAIGTATVLVLLLVYRQLGTELAASSRGIDLVVGHPGSPLQLVLSSVFHLDLPTGNIPESELQALAALPAVAEAIPLALGDSVRGYRVVGTTAAYPRHFGAELESGRLFAQPFEATVGSELVKQLRLGPGQTVVTSHGLVAGGEEHGATPLTVVGSLASSGTVLDRLVLVSLETVWALHAPHDEKSGEHDEHVEPHAERGEAHATEEKQASGREVTAILIRARGPVGAATLPTLLRDRPGVQAASPARESQRLLALLGVGLKAVGVLGILFLVAAAAALFLTLTTALEERRYDLAVMRVLGAGRGRLASLLLLDGVLASLIGSLTGVLLAHLVLAGLATWVRSAGQGQLSAASPGLLDLAVIAGAVLLALAAAARPAWRAGRGDIGPILAER